MLPVHRLKHLGPCDLIFINTRALQPSNNPIWTPEVLELLEPYFVDRCCVIILLKFRGFRRAKSGPVFPTGIWLSRRQGVNPRRRKFPWVSAWSHLLWAADTGRKKVLFKDQQVAESRTALQALAGRPTVVTPATFCQNRSTFKTLYSKRRRRVRWPCQILYRCIGHQICHTTQQHSDMLQFAHRAMRKTQ